MSKAVDIAKDAVQATPPVYVAAQTLIFGLPLSSWASLLAIVYTLLIILNHLRKQWLPWIASKPWQRAQWWK
jgi:hypothetical protein